MAASDDPGPCISGFNVVIPSFCGLCQSSPEAQSVSMNKYSLLWPLEYINRYYLAAYVKHPLRDI